jgi:hypothetical protein
MGAFLTLFLAVTELGAAVGGEHAAKMTTDWEGP